MKIQGLSAELGYNKYRLHAVTCQKTGALKFNVAALSSFMEPKVISWEK